ncbi:MAG: AAA family ATPase, partial [Gammaproteobacteria bacterium]|nr:AAA family ATPase [Gammaproteobacteria bacterium]
MYTQHFGLTEAPFSIAPNPRYLFMSRRHRDALAHLLFGVQSDGGFVLLTGEVGTGKTTLCRCLLEQIPNDVEIAFVLNPFAGSGRALLATICSEFGIKYPAKTSLKMLVDRLNTFLMDSHSNHRKAVLIIDEAQNLSYELLEQLRLLTNLETNERKLLQIILLGQPELLEMLEDRSLRQLSQRIIARFHLSALDSNETEAYITHRLAIAHGQPEPFTRSAMKSVYRISTGIPRVINL